MPIFFSFSRETQSAQLTLLNAVLFGTTIVLLSSDALDALIVVVLGGVALLGLLAFCRDSYRQLIFSGRVQ